jgi:hypothetical protein
MKTKKSIKAKNIDEKKEKKQLGSATSGQLKVAQLEQINAIRSFWFAWWHFTLKQKYMDWKISSKVLRAEVWKGCGEEVTSSL